MSSIIRDAWTYHGISAEGRGVFTNKRGCTYAGQCRDGYACGLGVTTYSDGYMEYADYVANYSNGYKVYAEYGPDGECDGRCLVRISSWDTTYYLYERGKEKEYLDVYAGGTCKYNYEYCEPDDPRVLALIAQVAPVEVRPAAPAAHPPSSATQTPRNRPMDQPARFAPAGAGEDRGHRGASPRRTPSLKAVRHKPTINRTAKHDHAVMHARTDWPKWSHGRPSCTLTNNRLAHT
jgi:hypothetical protein